MPSHAHDHWSLGSAESRDKSIWQRNRWKIPSLVPEQRGGTGVPEEKPCRIGTRQCPATRPREDQEGTPPHLPSPPEGAPCFCSNQAMAMLRGRQVLQGRAGPALWDTVCMCASRHRHVCRKSLVENML